MKRFFGMLALGFLCLGCSEGGSAAQSVDFGKASFLKEDGGSYVLDNGRIRLEIGKEHGQFKSFKNLGVNQELIASSAGLPFSLEYGYDRRQAIISESCPSKVSKVSLSLKEKEETLTLHYDDLFLSKSGKSTGIAADVAITIGNGSYFSYRCSFDLGKVVSSGIEGQENGIYALKLMDGYLKAAGEHERLTAPTWNSGQYWEEPYANKTFSSVAGGILGYPGINDESLRSGWLDYSGDKGGVGVCLINKQELVSEFRIHGDQTAKSMSLANVQFDPSKILGESVPLLKGEQYQTDDVFVIAHDGDWHFTADLYREEYEKAFVLADGSADYIHAGNMSSKARKLDYYSSQHGYVYLDERSRTFEEVFANLEELEAAMGAEWEHLAVWLIGITEKGYAFDSPFMLPIHPESGGEEGLKELNRKIHEKGGTVYAYEHPFAVDPDQPDIARALSSIDPGQHTEYWDGVTHHSVCLDNDVMKNMWENDIIPPQLSLGLDGWQFDQCPLVQTICDMEGHHHGLDALSRLSSHIKAVNWLQKMVKSKIEDSYLMSESYNDVCSRYCDIDQLSWNKSLLWDGRWEYGAFIYTRPSLIHMATPLPEFSVYWHGENQKRSPKGQSALYGCISGLHANYYGAEEMVENVRFKKAIRQVEHSGYPFGFRDNVGLTLGSNSLDARVYVEGENVTIVYLASGAVEDASIRIDLEKLGFAGKGSREFHVSLEQDKLDFLHFSVNDPA